MWSKKFIPETPCEEPIYEYERERLKAHFSCPYKSRKGEDKCFKYCKVNHNKPISLGRYQY